MANLFYKLLFLHGDRELYAEYLLYKRNFATGMAFILLTAKILYNILMIVDIQKLLFTLPIHFGVCMGISALTLINLFVSLRYVVATHFTGVLIMLNYLSLYATSKALCPLHHFLV